MTAYDENEILEELQTVLETSDNFDSKHITLGDPEILNRGFDRCVIIDSGEIRALESPYQAMGMLHTRYSPIVQVFRRYTRDKETRDALRDDCTDIMGLISSNNTLGDTVEKCIPRLAARPEFVGNISGKGPFYMMRRITVEIERVEES
jgi:hypothetical protein